MSSMSPADEARRRWLVRVLAAGALGTALLEREAAAADVFGGRPAKLPPDQSVFRIDGKVLVNGAAAAVDTRIPANATIETGPASELVFVVGDNAMLMRADSRLALEAASGGTTLTGFKLQAGRLLSVFATGKPKQLTTPTASIGITGTGVYLEADAEQTYFCTCYGVSQVASVRDPQSRETVASAHHDRPLYIVASGAGAGYIRNAKFINHTDQELMLIETLVGRTPPFNFPGSQYKTPRSTKTYR
jgi:hypothetical protein